MVADPDRFRGHLAALGISQLAEWDVLAFIYRQGTILTSAEQLARLLGYDKAAVGAALESLTSMGLVQRSRHSHGARRYRFAAAVPGDSRREALEELMKVAEERQGRVLLIRYLREAAARKEQRGRGGLHLA